MVFVSQKRSNTNERNFNKSQWKLRQKHYVVQVNFVYGLYFMHDGDRFIYLFIYLFAHIQMNIIVLVRTKVLNVNFNSNSICAVWYGMHNGIFPSKRQ